MATHFQAGDVVGEFTVLERMGSVARKQRLRVRCSCGVEKVLVESDIASGTTKSCGHLRRERAAGLHRTHGDTSQKRTVIYRAWESMRHRVSDPERYPTYVGITVHEPWRGDYVAFRDYVLAHLGERPVGHSLDRIHNDRGYEPGNLRWAPPVQQVRNRGITETLTALGVTRSIGEWAEVTGIAYPTLRARLRKGVPPDLAVTEPLRRLLKK